MNLVLIIYIANMIYSYICLREIELSFNHLHSQHDIKTKLNLSQTYVTVDHVGYVND
jgi:hypothetical protein